MKTIVLKIESEEQEDAAIEQADEVIRRGGLVAFPTETVYGLAASADCPQSIVQLNVVKQRPSDKPYTLHIGQKGDLKRYVPNLNLLDRHLVRKAWPGPCTFVFQLNDDQMDQVRSRLPAHQIEHLYQDNTIGIRLPDHATARRFLSRVNVPIVAPSANLASQTPPHTAGDVLDQLDGKIDLVIDGGPARYTQSSTVVKLADDGMAILREGVFDADTIRRMRRLNLLFVCTGNTCRSPMAEGLCRLELSRQAGCPLDQLEQKGYRVSSAGVMAFQGAPASSNAVSVCREKGVDISGHGAQVLTPELIHQADAIFVMDQSHYHVVTTMVGGAGVKTKKLDEPNDVNDPIGMPMKKYLQCADQIERALSKRLAEI